MNKHIICKSCKKKELATKKIKLFNHFIDPKMCLHCKMMKFKCFDKNFRFSKKTKYRDKHEKWRDI